MVVWMVLVVHAAEVGAYEKVAVIAGSLLVVGRVAGVVITDDSLEDVVVLCLCRCFFVSLTALVNKLDPGPMSGILPMAPTTQLAKMVIISNLISALVHDLNGDFGIVDKG